MLIMAEVTAEMGAELRAAALLSQTSVAVEVGRRLERLARLEEQDTRLHKAVASSPDGVVQVVAVNSGFRPEESLYSGQPNPWDMFRNTGNGR